MVDVNKEDYIMTMKLYIICGKELEPSNIGYNLCVIYAKSMKDAIDIQLKHNEQSCKKTSIDKVMFVRQVHRSLQEKFIGECGISIDMSRDASINILEPYINSIIAENYETTEEEDVDNAKESESVDISKVKKDIKILSECETGISDILDVISDAAMFAVNNHKSDRIESTDNIRQWIIINMINDICNLK